MAVSSRCERAKRDDSRRRACRKISGCWWKADITCGSLLRCKSLGERGMFRVGLALAILTCSAPAAAQSELDLGFEGALRGCENWVLEPATWADGLGAFASNLGLGDKAGWVESVDEAALPPPQMRVANHYFRINSTPNAGFILVVSDRAPFCHITGGGGIDLQPTIESTLASEAFRGRWQELKTQSRGDMVSTLFRSRTDQTFEMVISRARKVGNRLDRVQVLATAQYKVSG